MVDTSRIHLQKWRDKQWNKKKFLLALESGYHLDNILMRLQSSFTIILTIQIEQNLRGLALIQEESMQEVYASQSYPTTEEDDIGQMCSSKWIRYHLSMAVESTNGSLCRSSIEVFLHSLKKTKDYGKVP